MRIHVTRHHILTGCRQSGNSCPVHSAITDALGARMNGWRLSVSERSAMFWAATTNQEGTFRVDFTAIVTENIRRFDYIGEMEPFEFTLDDAVLARLDGEREVVRAG